MYKLQIIENNNIVVINNTVATKRSIDKYIGVLISYLKLNLAF